MGLWGVVGAVGPVRTVYLTGAEYQNSRVERRDVITEGQ